MGVCPTVTGYCSFLVLRSRRGSGLTAEHERVRWHDAVHRSVKTMRALQNVCELRSGTALNIARTSQARACGPAWCRALHATSAVGTCTLGLEDIYYIQQYLNSLAVFSEGNQALPRVHHRSQQRAVGAWAKMPKRPSLPTKAS